MRPFKWVNRSTLQSVDGGNVRLQWALTSVQYENSSVKAYT